MGVLARNIYRRYPQLCRRILKEERIRAGTSLYAGKLRTEVEELLWCGLMRRMGQAAAAAVCVLMVVAVLAGRKDEGEPADRLERPAAGEPGREIEVELETQDGWTSGTLRLEAVEYSGQELERIHGELCAYLSEAVLGENASADEVRESLIFPEELKAFGAVLSWSSEWPEVLSRRGEVNNEELEVPWEVPVTAKVDYGNEYRLFSMVFTVLPKSYSAAEEEYRSGMKELLRQEEETRTQPWFLLPDRAAGIAVRKKEEQEFPAAAFGAAVAALLVAAAYSSYFGTLEKKRKKRKEVAEQNYREFVTKLSVMTASGLSVRQAWQRLADDYGQRFGQKTLLAAELSVTERELENGCPEIEAYRMFGERMGSMAYRRLSSLLTQYVTKGVQGMQQLLLAEAEEVTAREREQVKVRGEEAGTKLLLPMMGLLVLVFAILLVPAFLSF